MYTTGRIVTGQERKIKASIISQGRPVWHEMGNVDITRSIFNVILKSGVWVLRSRKYYEDIDNVVIIGITSVVSIIVGKPQAIASL